MIVLIVIAVLLGVGAYVAYNAYQRFMVQVLTVPGCQAGTGQSAIPLDFGQAADAATVAAVAARDRLPARALTIAYATAFQESKLENLSYGDRDSVGIFQQRPSQGWGTAAQLQDPAYAARKFFGALVKVPNYTTIPVYQAAQAVQHSADGSAYQQYEQTGAQLAADFTTSAARGHLLVQPVRPGGGPEHLAQAQPARGGGGTGRGVRRPGARRGADRGNPHPFGISGPGHHRAGCRLDRGELAGHPRELLRDHEGQLRGPPVEGPADGNKLADRPQRGRSGGYCRQLARRPTILFGYLKWVRR